jgi:nitroimidazol reductase NimA-like FMN-containing flavoprotein (pyridoxamine 5'-phosphate oxidase superfamily)
MVIHEMTRDECLTVIAGGRLARLACARDNQPYVVPIYYAYDRSPDGEPWLYAFTTAGQKVEWMRANPRVCVEWDEVARYDQWASVVAFGRYEELSGSPDGPTSRDGGRSPERAGAGAQPTSDDSEAGYERRRAQELLRQHSTWWEPGCADWAASSHRDHTRLMRPLYYRIRLDQVTGRRATPGVSDLARAGTGFPVRDTPG